MRILLNHVSTQFKREKEEKNNLIIHSTYRLLSNQFISMLLSQNKMAKRRRIRQRPLWDLFRYRRVPTKPRTKNRKKITGRKWGSKLFKNSRSTRTTKSKALYDIPGPIPDVEALNNDDSLRRATYRYIFGDN